MIKVDERTLANMEIVLEDVCKGLSAIGGDHVSRKFIAQQLIEAAKHGNYTLGGLQVVGTRALSGLTQR